jgi:plastocyanin
MQQFALPLVAMVVAVGFGGCMDLFGNEETTYIPRTHEFDLFIEQSSNSVIALYPRNDNSSQNALAITFKLDPGDRQAAPGPEIRVKEGDTVIIHLQNPNGLAHTLHLHGGLIPWEQDGVDYLTQFPIEKGEEFTYTFKNLKAGTYWYHCHVDAAHHIDFGMYGAFIVEELKPSIKYDREYVVVLDEWDTCHVHGNTNPTPRPVGEGQEGSADAVGQTNCMYRVLMDNLAQNQIAQQTGQTVNGTGQNQAACDGIHALPPNFPNKQLLLVAAGCVQHAHSNPPQQAPRQWWFETHPMYNPLYNTFTVNGKAFPDTPVFAVREGEMVKFRIINAGNQVHTWHPHGHTMLVTHKDGYPWSGGPQGMDTLAIAPGERYDYVMKMDNPGLWMVHDQMGQYAANDNVHPGGMMACIAYDGWENVKAFDMTRSLQCHTEGVRILQSRGATHNH